MLTAPASSALPDWLSAALLGAVEGLTEFLPVSSTGHLLLAEQWLAPRSEAFNVIIQSGAVLAVLAAFRGRLAQMLATWQQPGTRRYLAQLAVAFGLTAVGGLALKALGAKLPETVGPVAWATLVGGILFLLVERHVAKQDGQNKTRPFGWPAAIAMGIGQLIAAAFPGASRSGTTILLALLCGSDRAAATEFSFLLGVPTLLAAGGVEVLQTVRHGEWAEPLMPLLMASAVSLVTAFVTVRWLLGFVRNHTFISFGLYRIALGAALLWLARAGG